VGIAIAAAIDAQAAPSASNLVWVKGTSFELREVRAADGSPDEMAAHEHSHGALDIYLPEQIGTARRRYFLKSQGAKESSATAQGPMTPQKTPGGK
jgi:hypothetical protein